MYSIGLNSDGSKFLENEKISTQSSKFEMNGDLESPTTIRVLDLPEFIKGTVTYQQFVEFGDEYMDEKSMLYVKDDTSVSSINDFARLLRMIPYWGITKIPSSMFEYVLNTDNQLELFPYLERAFRKNPDNDLVEFFYEISRGTLTKSIIQFYRIGFRLNILEFVEFLMDNGFRCNDLFKVAFKYDNVTCLRYTMKCGFLPTKTTCAIAAKYGSLKCLTFLFERGCLWDERTCRNAARFGQLKCLQYAHENGCPWSSLVCIDAAKNGHVECLRYVLENGCPKTREICSAAAEQGHLECLKCAREFGCKWNKNICIMAVKNNHLDCFKYAHENGCRGPYDICDIAAEHGHLECLEYAHRMGYFLFSSTYEEAIENNHMDCFRYLKANRCPVDSTIYRCLIKNGRFNLFQEFHERGVPWEDMWSNQIGYNCSLYHRYEFLVYAYEHGCELEDIHFSHALSSLDVDIILLYIKAGCGRNISINSVESLIRAFNRTIDGERLETLAMYKRNNEDKVIILEKFLEIANILKNYVINGIPEVHKKRYISRADL